MRNGEGFCPSLRFTGARSVLTKYSCDVGGGGVDPIFDQMMMKRRKTMSLSLTYLNRVTGGNLAEAIWHLISRTRSLPPLKRWPLFEKSPWNFGNCISIVLPLSYIRAILCHQSWRTKNLIEKIRYFIEFTVIAWKADLTEGDLDQRSGTRKTFKGLRREIFTCG